MGLSHTIARGVLAGLFTNTGVFQITTKGQAQALAGKAGRPKSTWLASVREEFLLLIALLIAIAALALTRKTDNPESLLWMTMLALQALPYIAALICAAVAAAPQWRARYRLTPKAFQAL
jgi:hypothetical protein